MNPFSWQQRNRDWPLILTIFLLGLGLMFFSGTLAIGLSPQWTVKASMDSKIDPNAHYVTSKSTQVIEPVLPAILTPPTWQAIYLTPPTSTATRRPGDPTATLKPQSKTPLAKTATTVKGTVTATRRVTGTATSRVTPSKTFWIIIASATITPKPKTNTPNATITPTPTKTSTPTITRTFTRTNTATKTATSTRTLTATITVTLTRTASSTITPTWTKSLTPTATFTPTITYTPTLTYTPTVTATWTNSLTPTLTLTPTETFTPTITITPSITFTPTNTVTPTPILLNWGLPDGYWYTPADGTVLNFTLSPAITDHGDSGYDFVYYERATGPTSIQMDQVIIEISQDGSTWYTVFNWGDGVADTNSNLNISIIGGAEGDNRNLSGGFLIGGSGVGIDIYSLGLIGSYPYLRITAVNNGTGDGIDINSIDIYP